MPPAVQVLQEPLPPPCSFSFYKPDTEQLRCLWGWWRHRMQRGCYVSVENLLTRNVCLGQLDRQEIHLYCVWATMQLGIIYYSNLAHSDWYIYLHLRKETQHLVAEFTSMVTNSRYVVKIVALCVVNWLIFYSLGQLLYMKDSFLRKCLLRCL